MDEKSEILLQEFPPSFRRPRAYTFDETYDTLEVSAFAIRSPRAGDAQSNQED